MPVLCFLPGALLGLSFSSGATHITYYSMLPSSLAMSEPLTSLLNGAKAKPWLQESDSVSMLAEENQELLPNDLI